MTAVCFLSRGIHPPLPDFDLSKVMAGTKRAFSYELMGYRFFLAQEGADKTMEKNIRQFTRVYLRRKFIQSSGTHSAVLLGLMIRNWRTDLAPEGAAKARVLADKPRQFA